MKTRTLIVFYLILFLTGLAIAGFPQGIVNNGGYINGTSSSYTKVSGAGDAFLINTSADQVTLGNLEVDFTGTGLYKLTITDSSYITVDGTLTLSDTLLIEADTNSHGSLITNSTVSGSYAAVEQHLTQDQWHMISSPVSSAQADVYTGIYLMEWGETDSTWSFITSLTDPLNVGQGYFAWSASGISSPTDVAFTGLLNTGNQSVSGLSYTTGSGKGNGWNLVGNPYSSPLEWNSSWTKTNIDATIYVYDGTNYLTWNYNLGGFGSMGNGYIPSTQAFWVKASASSPSLTIPNSERTHAAQTFYKSGGTPSNFLNIVVEGPEYSDQMFVGMYEDASSDFDAEFDAYKLFGSDDAPQIYTMFEDADLSVNIFELIGDNKKVVPIGFVSQNYSKYELSFENLVNFDPSIKIYLEDKGYSGKESKLYDIEKLDTYKFYADAEMVENRFNLHFIPQNEAPANESQNSINMVNSIYSYQKDVFVKYDSEAQGTAVVIDLTGREVARKRLTSGQLNVLPLNDVECGYYIVKVLSGINIQTEKVYIN